MAVTKKDSIHNYLDLHQPLRFETVEETAEYITLEARGNYHPNVARQDAREFCKRFNSAYAGAALAECNESRIVIAICPHIVNHPALQIAV